MASSIWKGYLTFGLVSVPVRLVRAARAERVNLHQLYRAKEPAAPARSRADVIEIGAPGRASRDAPAPETAAFTNPGSRPAEAPPPVVERVRRAALTQDENQPVAPEDVLKGFEYEPDRWVVIDREDIKRITPKTSKTMEISAFVRFDEIDPVYLESSYYVLPERDGAKPYALLYEAMRQTNYAAVAEVAMHNREHVMIIRAGRKGLIAHTMFLENEVRKDDEYRTEAGLAAPRELELAKTLVESLAGKFEPEKFRDAYREKLEALVEAKVQGREVAESAAAPVERAPVTDLVEALQKSLEATRKPPAPAPDSDTKSKKRVGRSGRA